MRSLLLALLLTLVAAPAHADDEPTGVQLGTWPAGEVVHVYAETPVDGWRLGRAIRQWRAAGVVDVWRTFDPAQADVTVRVSAYREIDGAHEWLGLAWVTNVDGTIDSALVELRRGLPREHRQRVTVHELGHTLGLDHSTREGSVMHDHEIDSVTQLDVDALRSLYAGAL